MSYWISLRDEKDSIPSVETHAEGGTFAVGGTDEADLNVTYNYAKHFDFRWLHNRQAAETLPVLNYAIDHLKDETSEDYWEPTEGNVRRALITLRSWAEQHPSCQWNVN